MSPSTIYQNQDLQQQQQQHSSSSASRPSLLKIKKDSHFIQKSSSSSSSSSVASSSALTALPKHHQQNQQHQQQRHPVIIYTHSPRVIHTKARDFMALVQKLTGLENDQSSKVVQPQPQPGAAKSGSGLSSDGKINSNKKKLANQDDNDSSSVVTGDENCGRGGGGGLMIKDVDQGIGGSTNSIPAHPNPYNMIDFPIFTPNSTTDSLYYPSSRPSFYTFPNPVISFANYMGNFNASPSFHHHQQVIKGGAIQEDY